MPPLWFVKRQHNMRCMRTADYTKPVTEHYENLQNRVQEAASNVIHSTEEYAQEHPWATIGIAAVAALAVGFIVGLALSRD